MNTILFNAENIIRAIALIAVVRYIGLPMFIEMRNMLERKTTEPAEPVEQGLDKPEQV